MLMQYDLKLGWFACVLLLLAAVNHVFANSNFNISPASGYPFPTKVNQGNTVSAYYTVTNNTDGTRSNYSIRGLPPCVVQDKSSSSYCSNSITLAPNQSCLLKLIITGQTQTHVALCKGSSCTSAAVPLNITQLASLPRVAVGSYENTSLQTSALSYTSSNAGAAWVLSNLPLPVPSDFVNSNQMASVVCNQSGSYCVSVGSYDSATNGNVPLSYTSTNYGQAWALGNQFVLPADATTDTTYRSSLLGGVTCDASGLICTAIGTYTNNGPSTVPLGYSSQDGGKTWSISIVPPPANPFILGNALPASELPSGFSAITCDTQGENCVIVGSYINNNGDTVPLSYISTNGGHSWTATTMPLPSDAGTNISVFPYTVSCDSNALKCVAMGAYLNHSNQYVPLSYISTNGGINWTANSTPLDLPTDITSFFSTKGVIKSVFCDSSGLFCTSVGYYLNNAINNAVNNVALTYTSNNGGMSWTLNTSILALPYGAVSSQLNGVTCDPDRFFCTAVGVALYASQSKTPIAYTSNDGGVTWVPNSTALPLPDNFNLVALNSVG